MAIAQSPRSHEIASQESSWSDASKLSRKVRELAHRSHRVLKARTPLQQSSDDLGDDAGDLRDQVARLQRKIHERRLRVLIPWVDALMRQVDDRLGNSKKASAR